MGRCVWRIVYRGEAGTVDFAGVDDIAVYSAKIIPSTYKPKIWGGCPTIFKIIFKSLLVMNGLECSHN